MYRIKGSYEYALESPESLRAYREGWLGDDLMSFVWPELYGSKAPKAKKRGLFQIDGSQPLMQRRGNW